MPFLHSGWRARGSVKRLNRNEFRQHLYKNMTKKSGKMVSQLTPQELQDINKTVNAMVDEEMKHYDMFEKANNIEKPKRTKKGDNVTMKNVAKYGEEFATSANVERQ